MAVLVEHQQFVVVEDRHGDGAGHFHDVAGQHGVFCGVRTLTVVSIT